MTRISELNWGKQRGKCVKSCSALLQVLVAARGPDGQVGSLVLLAGVRSEERRVGKSVDLGGRRIIKKKINNKKKLIIIYIASSIL